MNKLYSLYLTIKYVPRKIPKKGSYAKNFLRGLVW